MLRIKILPLSFTGTCYGGKAGKKNEEGDGKAEGRSQEGETFRRSGFFTPPFSSLYSFFCSFAIKKFSINHALRFYFLPLALPA